MSTALHDAVRSPNCNLKRIKQLIELESQVNVRDKDENSPLHLAVKNPSCDLYVITELLERGVDVNAKNFLWQTPLYFSVISDQRFNVIEKLLRRGADPNARDRNSCTVLHKAVQNPKCTLEVVKELLKYGADVDARQCSNKSSLLFAVQNHNYNLDIIDELLNNGALIDICFCNTPINKAVANPSCKIDLINVLLKYADKENVVHMKNCCFYPNVGDQLKGREALTTSLLYFAVEDLKYKLDIIMQVLQNGACIYGKDCKGRFPMLKALCNPSCKLDLIEILFKFGGYKDVMDESGNTLLHMAARNSSCHPNVINLLYTLNKEHIHLRNEFGETALDRAACLNPYSDDCNLIVVEALLKWGSSVNTDANSKSLLWKNLEQLKDGCRLENKLACIRLLIKYALIRNENEKSLLEMSSRLVTIFSQVCTNKDLKYYAEFSRYKNDCLSEIIRMKREIIYSEITLFEFIVDENITRICIANSDTMKQIHRILISNLYPMYCDFISFKVGPSSTLVEIKVSVCNNFCNKKKVTGADAV